ncbi:MAG: sensor histidine kinase [Phycisphaerae bacterium]
MTLARRLTLGVAGLGACLVVMATVTLWGLIELRRQAATARDEYAELRMIKKAEAGVLTAQRILVSRDVETAPLIMEIEQAAARLDEFLTYQPTQYAVPANHQKREEGIARLALAELEILRTHLADEAASLDDPAERKTLLGYTGSALEHIHRIADQMDQTVADTQEYSNQKLRTATVLTVIFTCIIALLSVFSCLLLYRSVTRPLDRLRRGVRRVARGKFEGMLQPIGDAEFRELAEDFNRTATELAEMHAEMEAKVAAKSKELVRSERLASVGFLAAGVAHEINNPLNIISGYAELALREASNSTAGNGPAADRESMRIIRDEAFRCKEIIEKLLSLAKVGSENKQNISVTDCADAVVSMLRGLKKYRGRRLLLNSPPDDDLVILANESELKQVLLNLTVNALESTDPLNGLTQLDLTRRGDTIEIAIRDNGRGMSPETLDHIFEPFFTRGRSERGEGVGLGLSISLAIVEGFGGAIRAQSEGESKGSVFRIQLPASTRETADDRIQS